MFHRVAYQGGTREVDERVVMVVVVVGITEVKVGVYGDSFGRNAV